MYKKIVKFLLMSSVLLFVALVLASSQPVEALNVAINQEMVETEEAVVPEIVVQRFRLTSDPVSLNSEYFSQKIAFGSELSGAYLTVYQITSNKQGWVVFHADNNGKPGEVIDQIQVKKGVTLYTHIESLEQAQTEPIHAMLHVDQASMGRLEFPYGPDLPVYEKGQLVNVRIPSIVN
jgi:hypothetical protein